MPPDAAGAGVYGSLGVRCWINARGHFTNMGGALLPEPVVRAMADAARQYVDVGELHRQVARRLADLTGNEAACVCDGAAAGLALATLACMTRGDPHLVARLPRLDGARTEVVLPRNHHNPFLPVVEASGATLVEVGNVLATRPIDLEAAIGPGTAAVLFMAGGFYRAAPLTLPDAIRIAHARDVPVIVDAAAEVPPPDSLRSYTRELDADLVVFSGGKALRGPQASGFIVGRRHLVQACHEIGPPNPGVARGMKVGKEEMVGLLAAVEWYLGQDQGRVRERFEAMTGHVVATLDGRPGLTARRVIRGGQPVPRIELAVDPAEAGLDAWTLERALAEADPPIAVDVEPATGLIYMTPETLRDGEERIVADRIAAIHARHAPAAP